MKDFHPQDTHAQLLAQAQRTQVPATTLARKGAAISAYAEEMAGTGLDFDPDLESAAIELLMGPRGLITPR